MMRDSIRLGHQPQRHAWILISSSYIASLFPLSRTWFLAYIIFQVAVRTISSYIQFTGSGWRNSGRLLYHPVVGAIHQRVKYSRGDSGLISACLNLNFSLWALTSERGRDSRRSSSLITMSRKRPWHMARINNADTDEMRWILSLDNVRGNRCAEPVVPRVVRQKGRNETTKSRKGREFI